MKLSYSLVIASAALGSTSVSSQAASSTFLFNQCECVSRSVAAVGDALFSPAILSGVDSFDCVDEDAAGFPADSGIIANHDSQDGAAFLTSTAEVDLFTDSQTSNRLFTYTFAEVEVDNTDNNADFIDLSRFSVGGNTEISKTRFITGSSSQAALQFDTLLNNDGTISAIVVLNGLSNAAYNATICVGEKDDTNAFACLDVDDGNGFSCAEQPAALGALVGVNNQVTLEMVRHREDSLGTADGSSYQINFLEFGNGLDLTNGVEAACNALKDLPRNVDTIPSINDLTFSVLEDNPVTMDVGARLIGGTITGNDLDFSIDVGDLSGLFNPADITNGVTSFTYTPDLNVNGDQDFTLTYAAATGQSIECSTSATFTLTIDAVNDAPVAVDSTHEVEATVLIALNNLQVATDVDFANGLLSAGFFDVNSVPAGEVTDCDNNILDTSSTLNVNNGVINLCYTPAATVTDGVTETLGFTVRDSEGDSDTGVITFNGNNPFVVTPFVYGPFSEEAVQAVPLNGLGEDRDGGNDVFFQIRITGLPDESFGRLTTDIGGNTNVAPNQEFDTTDTLFFHAGNGIFNADNGATVVNNRAIGVCAANERVDVTANLVVTDLCPIKFDYEIFAEFANNEVTESGGEGFFLINALDDGNATFGNAPEEQTVEVDGNGNGIVSLPALNIESDDGNDVFEIDMVIFGTDGVTFSGFSSVIADRDGQLNDVDEENCGIESCDRVILTGRPSVLEQALRDMDVAVPTGVDGVAFSILLGVLAEPEGTIDIDAAEIQVRILFDVDNTPPGFFEETSNILIVGGAAFGGVAIITMFFIYRTTRARAIGETNILALATQNVDKELRDKRKRERRERREKRRDEESGRKGNDDLDRAPAKRANDDDEIFDWEKHIDEKTKETYFFNPKTGESRWDPPTVKNTI